MKPVLPCIYLFGISVILSSSVVADLTVVPGDSYDNNDYYFNSGIVTNLGVFTNYLHFENEVDSLFINLASTKNEGNFINHSLLLNEGAFENNLAIYNYGDLINTTSGRFTQSSSSNFFNWGHITNNGVFNSFGNLTNADDVIMINTGTFTGNARFERRGHFNNIGELNIEGMVSFYDEGLLTNLGTVNNNNVLEIGSFGEMQNQNVFNNNGTIFGNNAVIKNAGVLNNWNNFGDITLIENNGVVNNYGMMNGAFDSVIHIGSTGTFNNKVDITPWSVSYGSVSITGQILNEGVLNNETDADISIDSFSTPAIINSGIINNAGNIHGFGDIVNSGELNNWHNITARTIESTGSINNHGDINADAIHINNGTLAGSGNIATYSHSVNVFIDGLSIAEDAVISPIGRDIDVAGLPVAVDETALMTILGDVLLDGLFDVDIDVNKSIRDPLDDYQDFDQLSIDGSLFLGSNSVLAITFLSPAFGYAPVDLITARAIYGEFSNNSFFHDGQRFTWEIVDGNYQDVLRLNVSAVPLPAGLWLFITGGLFLTGVGRKNRD